MAVAKSMSSAGDSPPDEAPRGRDEAVVFWSWIAVLSIGLAYMLAIPLSGR
jgi:hypothetical protein